MTDVIVFGTGNYFRKKRKSIEEKYNVAAYIDSSVKSGEERKYEDGRIVINPDGITSLQEMPVLLMSVRYMEMYERLVQIGIDRNRIIFGADFEPAYDPFEKALKNHCGSLYISKGEPTLKWDGKEYRFKTEEDLKKILRKTYRETSPVINTIRSLSIEPISRRYGREHGTPIDRFYIERFLAENRDIIRGDVGEFADDTYIRKFGSEVENGYVLHVNGWGENVIKANLVTGEGIKENLLDCLICTQTIQFIYDFDSVAHNINRILKKGGYALITAHGISQLSMYDYRNWGEYWRFTDMSLRNLFGKYFGDDNVIVKTYGNVKTATAMMYGLAVEDLDEKDFEVIDEQYPLILTVAVRKN